MVHKLFSQHRQPGQAMILLILAIIGLLGITALAVDASNAYADRRKAQTSSDNAALAGALARINSSSVNFAAHHITRLMGYPDSDVEINNPPAEDCNGVVPNPVDPSNPYDRAEYYIQVIMRTRVDAIFGPVIGVTGIDSCVSAIARAKPELIVPPFNGNAVVGLDPNGKSFHAHSNAQEWVIRGGGVFANHNAEDDHGNVQFPDGDCVTAVGTTTGFTGGTCTHPGSTDQKYKYPEDIIPLLPPFPTCDGEAYESGGVIHPEAGYEQSGSVWEAGFSGDVVDFAPGVYCLPNLNGNIHERVTGTDVTFFVTDPDFTMKYNGGGSFGDLSARRAEPYKGVLIFSAITPTPCTQDVDFRGNGSSVITGTIFMPSACLDWRGNSTGDSFHSMIIGYDVSTNGRGRVNVSYNPDDNYKAPDPPIVELSK